MGINMFAHLFGGGRTPQAAPPGKPKGKEGKGKNKAEEEKKEEAAEGEGGDDEEKKDEDDDEEGDNGEAASAAAIAAAVRQAVKAERARCIKIFSDPSAANNIPQACELAFNTSLSSDRVIAIMKTAAPPAKGGSLSTAMRGVQQPNLGDGGGGRADAGTDDEAAKAMLATMRRAGMIPKEKR